MILHRISSLAALAGLVLTPQPPSSFALLSIDGVDLPPTARVIAIQLDLEQSIRQTVAICHLPERWVLKVSNWVGGPADIIAQAAYAAAAVPGDRLA